MLQNLFIVTSLLKSDVARFIYSNLFTVSRIVNVIVKEDKLAAILTNFQNTIVTLSQINRLVVS